MAVHNWESQFHSGLSQLGVAEGDVLLVHASFKSLGISGAQPGQVAESLFRYVGAAGTLLMPALSYAFVTPDNPCFHITKTRSCVGAIPEAFRQAEGVERSIHPTHSVCARGRLSETLLRGHHLDHTPCGPNAPFSLLPEHEGKILMLGCGLKPNTSMHAIEECYQPAYLLGEPVEYLLVDSKDEVQRKVYTPHGFKGWVQRYDRIRTLPDTTWLSAGQILGAQAYLIEARPFWGAVKQQLEQDSWFFVDREV